MKYPRSPYDRVHGLVYFGRMLDKIRLHATGELHTELHENLGTGFDKRCVDFLRIAYDDLKKVVIDGAHDHAALDWCFKHGLQRSEEEIFIWSEFMRKRGWKDEGSEMLARRKKESGFENRADIETMFAYIDADEGREPAH